MFDQAEITVSAGRGGDGLVSFRREKFVPFGGPDGGDGGDGGNVVIVADASVTDLKAFRQKGRYRAGDGGKGKSKKRSGGRGADLLLSVPPGTVVTGEDGIIADLGDQERRVVVARGGRGGWGNVRFATPTDQAPRQAQPGREGEEKAITLELKLIADIGIIGYPNVGKSSLLAAVSAARPRVASYPFTTREPVLGVAEVGGQSFVLAEVPGLIDGAHLGRGLGHDFLRHLARTRMLIHLVDGGSPSPVEDMARIDNELALYDPSLAEKPQLVAVNKIDLPAVRERMAETAEAFAPTGRSILFISAATGEGVPELMAEAARMLRSIARPQVSRAKKVFRPRPL